MVYLKILLALIALFSTGTVNSARLKRQTGISQPNEAVIDSVFNIPITAIKQTAVAAQAFSPENSETIDNVFKIPISTLQAVGQFVKNRNPQKRQDIQEDKLRRLKLKKDRLLEKQEFQKLQKYQKDELRKKKFQKERYFHHKKNPLGINALNNFLGGHQEVIGNPGLGNFANNGPHVSHVGHASHDVHGNQDTNTGNGHSGHTYEVHEFIDEPPFVWPGWPGPTFVKIENKIAPKDDKPEEQSEEAPLENKVAPKKEKKLEKPEPRISRRSFRFESDSPPRNQKSVPENFWPSH